MEKVNHTSTYSVPTEEELKNDIIRDIVHFVGLKWYEPKKTVLKDILFRARLLRELLTKD